MQIFCGEMQGFFVKNGFFNKKTPFIMEKHVFFTKKRRVFEEKSAREMQGIGIIFVIWAMIFVFVPFLGGKEKGGE